MESRTTIADDQTQAATLPARLELSDVEFRGETIYFVVLDRFCRGNTKLQPNDEALHDPTQQDWNKYWGGDLQGLLNRLDYLKDLGVGACCPRRGAFSDSRP